MAISSEQLWNQVLERLRQQLSRPTFETWIQTAAIDELKEDFVVIRTHNAFVMNHLQKHYLEIISQVAVEILGRSIEIRLTVEQNENMAFLRGTEIKAKSCDRQEEISVSHYPKPTKLNPKYTFYRFVVGPTNRMVHAASLAVA